MGSVLTMDQGKLHSLTLAPAARFSYTASICPYYSVNWQPEPGRGS